MRSLLVSPLCFAGVGVARKNGHRPFVLARPLVGIPGSGISGAVVKEVEFRVVAIPAPGRAAAPFPLIAFPCVDRSPKTHFFLGSCAVHAPDPFAGLHIIGGDKSTNAKFSAADAGDHFVFDDHWR